MAAAARMKQEMPTAGTTTKYDAENVFPEKQYKELQTFPNTVCWFIV